MQRVVAFVILGVILAASLVDVTGRRSLTDTAEVGARRRVIGDRFGAGPSAPFGWATDRAATPFS